MFSYYQSGSAAAPRTTPIPWPVRLLLLYLAAITIIGKGPTYLGYPPLFWGEMVLAVLMFWSLSAPADGELGIPEPRPLSVAVLLYVLLGVVLTAISYPRWGLDAIRDAAIWYYAAFYFFGVRLARQEALADRVWKILQVFWILAMLWGLADHVTDHRLSELGPVLPWRGISVLSNSNSELLQNMALGALLVLCTDFLDGFPLLRLMLCSAAVPALVFFLLSRSRGQKVGLLVGILSVLLLRLSHGQPLRFGSRILRSMLAAAVLVGVAALVLQTDIRQLTNFDRFAEDEGTATWRVVWWKQLAQEVFFTNPAFGLGFGREWQLYNPEIVLNRFDPWPVRAPHNFNVTVFSRMGIVGSMLWAAILVTGAGGLFARIWRGGFGLWRYPPQRREELAFWLLMILATWGNGSFGVLMEGPVLGVWFWFALGFASRRSLPPPAAPAPLPGVPYAIPLRTYGR